MEVVDLYPKVTDIDHVDDLEGFIAHLLKSVREMPPLNIRGVRTPAELLVQFDHGVLAQSIQLLRARYQVQLKEPKFFSGVSSFLGSCSLAAEKDLVVVGLMKQLRDVYVELENKGMTGATRAFYAAFPMFENITKTHGRESDAHEFVMDFKEESFSFAGNLQVERVQGSSVAECEEDPVLAFCNMRMGP